MAVSLVVADEAEEGINWDAFLRDLDPIKVILIGGRDDLEDVGAVWQN